MCDRLLSRSMQVSSQSTSRHCSVYTGNICNMTMAANNIEMVTSHWNEMVTALCSQLLTKLSLLLCATESYKFYDFQSHNLKLCVPCSRLCRSSHDKILRCVFGVASDGQAWLLQPRNAVQQELLAKGLALDYILSARGIYCWDGKYHHLT